MSVIELASGHAMPLLGLGTWQLRGGECTRVLQMALEMGYRHLDTAYNYKNQVEVARGASGEWNRARRGFCDDEDLARCVAIRASA